MTVGVIIALIGLGLTVIGTFTGFAVVWGRFTEKLSILEKRMEEDRGKNQDQHETFFVVQREQAVLASEMRGIGTQLTEVKADIKEILSRLPLHRREGD